MRKNLFSVSAIVAIATLVSCSQESMLDPTVVSVQNSQTPIEFSTYASTATATRGTAVNSNGDFQTVHGSFDVTALVNDGVFGNYEYYNTATDDYQDNSIMSFTATPVKNTTAVDYFNFSTVNYTDGEWVNANKMYWPNYSKILYFAAYSPSSLKISETDYTFTEWAGSGAKANYTYSFPYSVTDAIDNQIDLMYAMTSVGYLAPSDRYKNGADDSYVTAGVYYTNTEESVNLHFKHALTQIAFTATKDADIDVYVKSITICNVYNGGTFTATALTDDTDESDSQTDATTVGDSGDDGDKVNADNFGTWEATYSGTWVLESDGKTATAGGGGFSAMSNYEAAMSTLGDKSPAKASAIKVPSSTDAVQLTSTSEVLMLMPQALTAWVPTTSTTPNYCGSEVDDGLLSDGEYANPSMTDASRTLSYLAIDCEIYHEGMTNEAARIHDGYLFVPFETTDISYSSADVDNAVKDADEWLAGYKITYCLNFGGGYVVDEDNHDGIPEPGCIPDTETLTLRTVQYTTSVDTWVDVAESQDLEDFVNGEDTDTSYTPKTSAE